MQNMEKYFGFRVELTDELDPVQIIAIKEMAQKILNSYNFNEEEYYVYFHQLCIFPKDSHFGVSGGIQERLESLRLEFSVNPKQVKNGSIKLINYLLDYQDEEGTWCIPSATELVYSLEGKYVAKRKRFRNEIVTFIKKNVRTDHRKIKLSVNAFPTLAMEEKFNSEQYTRPTQLDFRFNKPITLKMPEAQ